MTQANRPRVASQRPTPPRERNYWGMLMAVFNPNDPDAKRKMRGMLGPQQVDNEIRQAISFCWMMMPDDKKNPDAVATEIRRIVERALANLQEDATAFGVVEDDK